MFWFIQVSVVSLIIIFVLHNLYSFFKETLTVPKIKDMVKRPQQKYDVLFRELRNQGSNSNDDMKNELKRYLMDLNSEAQPQSQYPQPQYPQSHPQYPQSQYPQSQPQYPQPHPQPQSDFIELGSTYQ
jgi:hypothetical protein